MDKVFLRPTADIRSELLTNASSYRDLLAFSCFLVFCTAMPSHSTAQEEWQFKVSPYLWTPGLAGDISPTAMAPTASVDMDIADVLSKLNLGVMGMAEARKGRWSVLGNVFYANISEKEDVSLGPGIVTPSRSIKVGARTFFAGLGVGYDIYADERARITTAAGLRYWDVENELRVTGGIATIDTTESETWVDPLIGIGGVYDLGDGFSLEGYADVGGFGIGSDLTWSVLGLVGYRINEATTATLGWRHLAVDYDDDGFLFDVGMSGPIAGITFNF